MSCNTFCLFFLLTQTNPLFLSFTIALAEPIPIQKAKSDQSPQEALQALLDRGGVAALFKGLPIRMLLYSLNAAFQFLIYDGVRFSLGVGPDDLRLYLDVLGEALNQNA